MTGEFALWAEIDLGAVRANVAALRALLDPGTKLLAVVKANAYGHGDVDVARAAIEAGADWLGIARVQEGRRLRDAGIAAPMLLLAEPPAGAAAAAVELDLTLTVYTEAIAQLLSEAAVAAGVTRAVHVKVDTGMHRYGRPPQAAPRFLEFMSGLEGLVVEGLWTHFAVAEETTNPFTKQQLERFLDISEELGPGLVRHAANSAATLSFPASHLDMVRCGIAVYGISPSPELRDIAELTPAMSLKSRVGLAKRLPAREALSYGLRYTLEKPATVVTIPCGYADGMSRALSNEGRVLIGGVRYPIAGTITMDHLMVNAGDADVDEGEEVVFIGRQGDEEITAQEIADRLGTIPYEIVCAVSARVPRVCV